MGLAGPMNLSSSSSLQMAEMEISQEFFLEAKMEIVTSTSAIVPEVLKEDNYERWSILMEHYLVAQDLWGVVQSSKIPGGGKKREWMKKNALALHAIGISCGREAFDQIKNIRSAKGAWDALAAKLKPPPIVQAVTPDISEPHQERQTVQPLLAEQQETLQKLVCCESISEVKRFLHDNRDIISAQMLDSALQHAITCGRKKMARYLYSEIPLDFLQGDSGFFLLERCITKGMFDIALDLLHDFPDWAFRHPWNSTPIVSTLAQTAPPFFNINELGSWGRWIYKSTRVKAFPIKSRSAPAGVGIVQDMLRKWILPVLYKFHLVCVMIGLLCWMPCWLPGVRINELGMLFVFELFLLLVVPLLKLDLLFVLIGVPLFWLLVPPEVGLILLLERFLVFILLLVIIRVILLKLDKKLSRQRELPCILLMAAELLRMPIGVPLLLLGAPISLSVSDERLERYLEEGGTIWGPIWRPSFTMKDLMHLRVAFFSLFLLFSIPLLIFVIQKYKLKLTDEYAHEVTRFICGSLSNLDESQFVQSGAVEATYQAVENDIPEIVIELLKGPNGNILWSNTDPEDSRNMFAHAVAHRQEKVARFLYDEFGEKKDTNMVTATDEDENNILHIAAQLAPHSQLNHISGAALQLQSELHWFKSVEGIVPQFNKQKNKDGKTPTQVFLEEHEDLVKDAEGWMKKVAESCTVVGALVITIMFAAAFTVPGGNDQSTGFPIFLNTTMRPNSTMDTVVPFKVFAVSDAISLFAASSSVLMFMGILTSRYACQDFHISLPIKLIIGLSSLFISIAAMVVAFCATLLMMLHDEMGIVISIIFLAAIPVTLFILLQSPLLVEIYGSTFRPDIFNRRRYWKYGKNVYSCFNRRWWFKMRRGWMVVILCALVLLNYISLYVFLIKLYG